MRAISRIAPVLGLAAAGFMGIDAASARVETADVGLNQSFLQNSDSGSSLEGAFFSARVFFDNVGEYTSGTLTVPTMPTATTYPLASQGYDPDVEIGHGDGGSLSAMQAKYPAGDYGFVVDANGSNPEVDLTIPYGTPAAYPNVPEVTNYDTLNGMDAATGVTVDINGLTPSLNSTENHIYVDLYAVNGNKFIFGEELLPIDVTSFAIPGGELDPGTSYYFDLIYDGRIVSTTGGDTPITLTQFYDMDTEVDFTTGGVAPVPEPSTWAMLLTGFLGLGFVARRRMAAARTRVA